MVAIKPMIKKIHNTFTNIFLALALEYRGFFFFFRNLNRFLNRPLRGESEYSPDANFS